ncbi:MAG: hypothetical protein K0S32_4106 [Bacteroidetes bacterium]|nr:hypothetical protein [Bacteroidota bacterium]
MKTSIKLLVFAFSLPLLLSECKKKTTEPEEETPTPTTPTNPTGINTIAEVFAANGAAKNVFTVSATSPSTINVNGVKIEIPANSLVTSSGGTLTGNVEIGVKTILDKEQVILTGAAANSSGALLVATKGCVKMEASQNTNSLRLFSTGIVTVAIPDGTTTPTATQKFYTAKVTAVDSTKMWALGTDLSTIPTAYDNSINKYVHRAALDSLKWLNVGAQYDSIGAPKTVVTASLNSSMFSKSNAAVFISFNGSLTVGALFEVSPGIFKIKNMPVGKGAHIVAIGVINGQYYSADQSVLISSSQINLNMQATTITAIKSQLQALP